jgi:hypothetical protein
MFENFQNSRRRKTPWWAYALLIPVVIFHAVLIVGWWVKSVYAVEYLSVKADDSDLFMAAIPPPPPPLKGGKKPQNVEKKIRKVKVTETVQPVKIEKMEEIPTVTDDVEVPAIPTARSAAIPTASRVA